MQRSFLIATVLLALSSLVSICETRQCSIILVRGANNKMGAGFGVVRDGSVPRTGTAGDAGADATSFSASANPNPACGRVAKIPGNVVKISDQTTQAIQQGLPTVYSNGSIPFTVFQVNRDGGGPMTCEYSSDATGNSWQPMDVTLNMPGNFGEQKADRVQYSVVATFRAGSRLTGGPNKDVGVVRCRAGVQQTCGGCFAVQMDGQITNENGGASVGGTPATGDQLGLTSQQMSVLMSKVIKLAQKENLVYNKS